MAPSGGASPRVVWVEPKPEHTPRGKNVVQKTAAVFMKGGRELASAPSRSGRLRKRGAMAEGESRSASRFSMFMENLNVGNGEQGRQTSRRSVDCLRDMDGGLQPAEETQRKSISALKDALSFRKTRERRVSNMTISSPMIDQSAESKSAIEIMRAECEDAFVGSRIVPGYPRRTSSRVAPSLPLLTFPSMIKMPSLRQPVEDEVSLSSGEDEYSGDESNIGEASIAYVLKAKLVTSPRR